MLSVTNYKVSQSKDGSKFISLTVEGGIEMVQSLSTGAFYAKSKKCFIPFTGNEEAAKAMIGCNIPGTIERVECLPYEYRLNTNEVITLYHTYQYQPENAKATSQDEYVGDHDPISIEAMEA